VSEQFEQLAAYLGLLVQHAGGEVRIPFDKVEEGLPANSGVRVIVDSENEEIVFVIQEIEVAE
jgi:hypothetical protein